MKYLDKKKVKDALTISEIVEMYSPKYKIKGKAIFFLCPFHDDHNLGSCYAYLDAHSFKCSACQEKADVLKLASKFTDIPLNNMNRLLEKLVQDFEHDTDPASNPDFAHGSDSDTSFSEVRLK